VLGIEGLALYGGDEVGWYWGGESEGVEEGGFNCGG
jgi:hypothetical protein